MSVPIPSFFKMRLIIAVALVFFGFFFIGLLHRAFAEDCTICIGDAYSSIGYTTHFYDTIAEAYAASGGSCAQTPDPPGPVGDPFHDCEPFYYCISGVNRYIHCTDSDPCADVSPSPVVACYSESNITWTDQSTCEYTCTCPDYTGQENYNFETCTAPGIPSSCDGVSPSPVVACYSESNITWTDQSTCEYTCTCPDYTGQENYDFGVCAICDDTDADGTFDVCDDCPDDPDITVSQQSMTFFCQDSGGFSPGDYCGYLSIDCHGDGDSTWNPVSGMAVDFMMRCCTPAESTSSCVSTDSCEKDSDGDGIADSEDPDDDNDGIPDTEDDDDDGDGIPDDEDIDRDSDGDGIPDKYDTDDDNDGIPDTEDDDDDGDGIPDDEEGDYKDFDESPYTSSSLSEAAGRFGTRFQLFISTMKNTSLFSLPSNFVGNVPSGGNSVLVIDGGETYGQQVIDFSHWSAGWLVFRTVILLSSSFIALRILTLKH